MSRLLLVFPIENKNMSGSESKPVSQHNSPTLQPLGRCCAHTLRSPMCSQVYEVVAHALWCTICVGACVHVQVARQIESMSVSPILPLWQHFVALCSTLWQVFQTAPALRFTHISQSLHCSSFHNMDTVRHCTTFALRVKVVCAR